jgi:cytidyltransferase-like protein
MKGVFASGCFDDLRARAVRLLEEASRLGPLTVFLRDDASATAILGRAPKFSLAERRYFLEALRWVDSVRVLGEDCPRDSLPGDLQARSIWVMAEEGLVPRAEAAGSAKLAHCAAAGLEPVVLGPEALAGYRCEAPPFGVEVEPGKPKVIVTGSFDWLHTGHVRFFEEAAGYGELTVVVGHDANIRLLKGEGHPLIPEEERRYMVASIRHVARSLISTGSGWLDAEPEIDLLEPDLYVVNADGDKEEKRAFCAARGIEYIVLERAPRPGLPRRSSTDLRGF